MTNASRYFWLFDRMTEIEMKPAQIAVMFALLVRDDMEGAPLTKAELGALIGVKERQVSTILKDLQDDLKLIEKQRRGGAGKGRVANLYAVRPDATGNPVPETWCQQPIADSGNQQSSTGTGLPAENSNQHAAAGSQPGNSMPVACGQVEDAEYEHAHARGEDNLLTLEISSSSEPVESSFNNRAGATVVHLNGSAKALPAHTLLSKLIEIVDSPSLDARSAGLAKTCTLIPQWMADGADFDADIVPTVSGMCARMQGEPIRSLAYFTAAIRSAAASRIAIAQRPFQPITPSEARNDFAPRASGTVGSAGNVRRKRDPVFDSIFGREPEDAPPLDYGRVDFNAGK